MIDDRLVLVGHGAVHPQLAEHVHHQVDETASGRSLHHGAEQGEGVGGVQESCAWASNFTRVNPNSASGGDTGTT